ncbi:MAG: hypothetical protein NC177_04885 [Ruminococcus flavefaciens]|nr:hypothetical protein [Ruminococcus flavefaciens]
MFNWNGFWNYYSAVTNDRNRDKVGTMQKGFDIAWRQYFQKHNPGCVSHLFINDVLYGKGSTEYYRMVKTQMLSLGLSTALADGVIKHLKKYCKDTK